MGKNEEIIDSTIVEHLSTIKLLLPIQHDFHPSLSVHKNLTDAYMYATKLMDMGSLVDMIFLDLAKAFDKVCHKRLILKSIQYAFVMKLWMADIIFSSQKKNECRKNNALRHGFRPNTIQHLYEWSIFNHNLWYIAEHGLRKNRSHNTQLTEAINDFQMMADLSQKYNFVYVNLYMAFDKVSNLYCWENSKITGLDWELLLGVGFLTDRSENIRVGEALSN